MIFIAAQRVVSPVSPSRKGINVYFYRADGPPPFNSKNEVDAVAEQPRELVYVQSDIKPGGNRVPAFLDFASVDAPSVADARAFLKSAEEDLARMRPPLTRSHPHFGLCFNTDVGLYGERLDVFRSLADAVLRMLENPPRDAFRDKEPLTIVVKESDDRISFELSDESIRALKATKGDTWSVHPIGISHSSLSDFEDIVGGALAKFGQIVTRLEAEELVKLGGVKYVTEKGKELGRWPSRNRRG